MRGKKQKEKKLVNKKSEQKEEVKEKVEVKKKEFEKKKNEGYIILVVLFMIVIAFLIGFFYTRQKILSSQQYYYNNYKFVRNGMFWNLTIKKGYIEDQWVLRYSPRELLDIPVVGNMSPLFKSKNYVYITFDPFDDELSYVALAAGELSIGLSRFLNKRPIPACTQQDNQGCLRVQIVNCTSELYKDEPIIYLNHEAPTMLIFDKNCVIIQGREFELVRSADLLMLKLYGVMK
ncbi:MAG: hypothetical protein QXU20_00935 [Candidatus Woesearchaeota archaeon]